MTREPIAAALWALVSATTPTPGWQLKSRHLQMHDLVPAQSRPALLQALDREVAIYKEGTYQLVKWHVFVNWFVYVNRGKGESGSQKLAPYLDAIEAALRPQQLKPERLGLPAVQAVQVLQTEYFEGNLDTTAVGVVVARVTVTP